MTTASATGQKQQTAGLAAPITQITVEVLTADEMSADAVSRVYLGLGGREFRLAKDGGEFARGARTTFTLGEGADVAHSGKNDPRAPRLTLADLARRAVYLRMEEAGEQPQWLLERALLTVNAGTDTATSFDTPSLVGLEAGHKIWLGADQGLIMHLECVGSASAHWPLAGGSGTGVVVPRPSPGDDIPSGGASAHTGSGFKETPVLDSNLATPYIIAVECAGTSNYLRPDYADHDNVDQRVQIWNHDVIRNTYKAYGETMQWRVVKHDDGTYSLLSNPQLNALTAEPDGQVLLRGRTDASKQRWHLRPVPSTAGNTYIISPADQPDYALRRDADGHDTYVSLMRMWGGTDPYFAWHIHPAPADIRRMYPLPTPAA